MWCYICINSYTWYRMKFFVKIGLLLVLIIWSNAHGFAQDSSLVIRLNKSFFHPGDTLHINASEPQKKTGATLFLMAEHENGFVWQLRWPMLKGECAPELIIPDSMPQGQYRLHFSLLQNLFTVSGKVKSPDNIDELFVTLLTSGGDLYENEIPVDSSGRFTYKNVLFENTATLLFTQADKRKNNELDIEISTVLDSVSFPRRSKILEIYIGDTKPPEVVTKFNSIYADPGVEAQTLETVIVHNKPLNRGELFNKKYSNGLFNDMNERMLNFLDDQTLANSVSLFQALTSRVPGLSFINGANPGVFWRNQPVVFYLDELRVNATIIDGVPIHDIAIIKTYPPPFFGNPAGNGGGIAVYTKRGGITDDNYKNAFRVKGYTPLISKLPTMPDGF